MRKEFKLVLANMGYLVNEYDCGDFDNLDLSLFFSKSLSSLGYLLSKDSFTVLNKLNKDDLRKLYFSSIDVLKELKGDVNHIIFYKDFPNMEKYDEGDYLLRALLHYYTVSFSSYGYLGDETRSNKLEEEVFEKFDTLSIISEDEALRVLTKYFNNLIEGNVIISGANYTLMKLFMKDYPNLLAPSIIPIRMNLVMYINAYLDLSKDKIGNKLEKIDLSFIKTSTDLLRLYAIISDCDPSLDKGVYFISLDRKARRIFLSILDSICKNNRYIIDDLDMYEFLWKKAFEYLHIGEYKNVYPYAYNAAVLIRSGKYQTYNSLVCEAINNFDTKKLLSLLKAKPGIFARNLDMLLRNDKVSSNDILDGFKEIACSLSTKVLIGLWEFYKNRNDLADFRIFMFRHGLGTKFYEACENRNILDEALINRVIFIIEEALINKFSCYENLGKVYLAKELENYRIPNNNRNASLGYKTISYGSKIKLEPGGNILRFFTHWQNNDHRVDVDLSLELYDDNYKYVTTVGWHNMAGGKMISCYHSGDITTAPMGASEFVDLNYEEAKKIARYVVVCNSVYTGDRFCDIPNCFSGVMFRKNLGKKGEVFDPRSVVSKFNLTQKESNMNIALAVDLKSLELIWLDIPKNSNCFFVVAKGCNEISYALRKVNQKFMSIYDLVMFHKNRFELVSKKDADFIIDLDINSDLSPYSLDEIARDWL